MARWVFSNSKRAFTALSHWAMESDPVEVEGGASRTRPRGIHETTNHPASTLESLPGLSASRPIPA